jgi:hypothetical protein
MAYPEAAGERAMKVQEVLMKALSGEWSGGRSVRRRRGLWPNGCLV